MYCPFVIEVLVWEGKKWLNDLPKPTDKAKDKNDDKIE